MPFLSSVISVNVLQTLPSPSSAALLKVRVGVSGLAKAQPDAAACMVFLQPP